MDKASERKKDSKSCGDTDEGIRTFGPDNKREALDGLWDPVSAEIVNQPLTRLMTNCYRKDIPGEKADKPDLLEEVLEHGFPLGNVSRPKRIF